MPTKHTVKSGETLSAIARQHGIADWRTLYNHPDNAPFRQKRPNPNLIHAGDEIIIPDKPDKHVTVRSGAHHVFVVKPSVPMPGTSWLKVRAYYQDPWQTPITEAKINIHVEGVAVAEEKPLPKGAGKNTHASTQVKAEHTTHEPGTLYLKQVPAGTAEVEFAREEGLEAEIATTRNSIDARLNGAYLDLLEQMSEFQQQWDRYGAAAIYMSTAEGVYAGAANWMEDQGELFEAKTWTELGNTIADAAGDAWDFTASYARETFDGIKKKVGDANKHIDDITDNAFNWNWWSKQIDQTATDAHTRAVKLVDQTRKDIEQAQELLKSSVAKTEKIYKHRNAILNLHKDLAAGDIQQIERFIDTVLMDIDPALAREIKDNPDWAAVIEVIADHDSILTYLAYVSLFLEAVPPNFYAYLAGKGNAYLLMELLLLLICSVLSAGTAAVGRLTMLAARITATSARVGKAGAKIRKGVAAIKAFARTIDDFTAAAQDLHGLGNKLKRARASGIKKTQGKTGGTLEAKKQQEKRNKKCRVCGKENRKTPRHMRGTVEYD